MNEFIIRTKYDKKEKLLEYTELVAGIRLFNKHCGKGGEGIEDVPKMLRRAIEAMQQEIQKILLNVMQKVNVLTTILDIHFVPTEITKNNYEMVLINLPEGITLPDIERIKNLLVMFRQYEIFVRRLLSRVIQVEQRQEEISEKLWKMYDMINIVVQFKIAVPAHEVFPLFRELAKTWYKIQDEALLLSKFNDVLVSLSIYIKQTVYPEYERQDWVTEQLLGGHQPQTDAERMRELTKNTLIPSSDPAFQLKTPDNVDNIHALNFEFLGFCPWKMVATNGGLIPGNPNLGFVENKGKRYIFSNSLAMNIFNTDAKNYLNRALELFRRKPDMIHFLGVENELLAVKDIEQLIPPELKRTETFSVECQTIDHPIPANIDPNYKWNVWDLKRDALLLANLSHCKTSSTQTEECAGLSPAKTQTYDLKEQGVQTKRDHGTNVPKPLQYIFGLRGRLDDKQIQLDLTETVEHSC
ncbi:hypothetical protein WA026_008407 [Henosepilachna vigintioctopunctata]|uniref:Cilia- and flagella-associated protein 206 n=1 Tax=Henosepilachna vigintioctopunctata TaxID=420089 RepID=A0AAW1UGI7_9CUCU